METGIRDEMLNKELQIRGSSAVSGIERHQHPYWPWTLQRNRSAIMRMIASGDLKVDHLVSHVAKPEEATTCTTRWRQGPRTWMSVRLGGLAFQAEALCWLEGRGLKVGAS